MREIELKAIVSDPDAVRARLRARGATLLFAGSMHDRQYDNTAGALDAADFVLRLRVYQPAPGAPGDARASLDWKGPTIVENGYKQREEITARILDSDALHAILEAAGFHVILAIDREIELYRLDGATVRIEQYPRLDVLIEVEGNPSEIERAIAATGLPRAAFGPQRLADFAQAFEARTGQPAVLSAAAPGSIAR